MKKSMSFIICLLLALSTLFVFVGCDSAEEEGVTTIKMSVVWNGLSSMKPTDNDNRIAKIIRQKTGVKIDIKWVNGTENEQLVRIFSTGRNMPDVIMSPYWGGGDSCSDTIRKAAKDGLLLPLDDLIADYAPNLTGAFTEGVAKNFVQNELSQPEFDGKKYILPMHTPQNIDEYQNWGYTVYARKDILKALNVDASQVNTSEKVYELAKKINEGGFVDINGNAIIPASCWAYGYGAECYMNSFKTRGFTEVVNKGDHYEWSAFQSHVDDEVKFMQKMVSEGVV